MEFGSGTPFKHLRQVGLGLASRDKLKRVAAVELLLSWLLHRLSEEQLAEHLGFAPPLSTAHMPDARLYPNREAMLHALPRGGRVAEVGTYRGAFAQRIAATCAPDEFHLIDIDLTVLDKASVQAAFAGRLIEHQGDSAAMLATLPAASFDWIYLDADHRTRPSARISPGATPPCGRAAISCATTIPIGTSAPPSLMAWPGP